MRTDDMVISTSTKGDVRDDDVDYALGKVDALAALPREPVLGITVRLVREPDPARERPCAAEAVIDVNGTPVRGHVAAATMTEAVDLLVDRLRRRITRHEDRLHRLSERRWTGEATDHEWRHGDLSTQRPPFFDRPAEEREIVRRKSFALAAQTVDEAAVDLDALAHDFFLFTDLDSGSDCVLAYGEDGSLVLQCLDAPPDTSGTVVPVAVDPTTPPELDEAEAIASLDESADPMLFFRLLPGGRGAVIYRRYDGHYGLIEPAG